MSFKQYAFLGAALLLRQVAAHGFVQGIQAEGKYYPGQSYWSRDASPGWKAENGDTGFSTSLIDQNIICHNNAVAGTLYVTVAAGSSIELQWNSWPESHRGPMLDYLAPCGDDCQKIDKTALQFTKIAESGLIDGGSPPQHWASDDLISNNFTWVTTIPASVAPGKYVLRHEAIALHSAFNEGGAQAYPQCINLEITGSGTNALSSGTLGTKLYTPTDPGILINIYRTVTNYTIPGPSVMAGGSKGVSGSSSRSSSTASATTSVTASAASTSAKPSSATTRATSFVVVTTTPSSKAAFVSSTTVVADEESTIASATSASASAIPTIGGRKFVCYEEL